MKRSLDRFFRFKNLVMIEMISKLAFAIRSMDCPAAYGRAICRQPFVPPSLLTRVKWASISMPPLVLKHPLGATGSRAGAVSLARKGLMRFLSRRRSALNISVYVIALRQNLSFAYWDRIWDCNSFCFWVCRIEIDVVRLLHDVEGAGAASLHVND